MFSMESVERAVCSAFAKAKHQYERHKRGSTMVTFTFWARVPWNARRFWKFWEKRWLTVCETQEGVGFFQYRVPGALFLPCSRSEVPEFLDSILPPHVRIDDPEFPRNA